MSHVGNQLDKGGGPMPTIAKESDGNVDISWGDRLFIGACK